MQVADKMNQEHQCAATRGRWLASPATTAAARYNLGDHISTATRPCGKDRGRGSDHWLLITPLQNLGKPRLFRLRELRLLGGGRVRIGPAPAQHQEQAEGADEQDRSRTEP